MPRCLNALFVAVVMMAAPSSSWTLKSSMLELTGEDCGPNSATVTQQMAQTTYRVSSASGDSSGLGTFVDDSTAVLLSCTVEAMPESVTLRKAYHVGDGLNVTVTETLTVQEPWITATVTVAELQSVLPVSFSVSTGFNVANSDTMQFWAPWDRESSSMKGATYVDPLNPSDGHLGFWDGSLTLGQLGTTTNDKIVAAAFMIMKSSRAAEPSQEPNGTAFGLALGPGDNACEVNMYVTQAGSLRLQRNTLRFGKGVAPAELTYDLIPMAPDWRALMQALTTIDPHASFWHAPIGRDAALDRISGLGTYSWWLGQPNSSIAAEGVKVGWDLGGRFFPYMGMFLPPVETETTQWLNDAEGTQPRANVTLAEIAAYYAMMQSAGVTQLSYFNINEFGTNVKYVRPSSADASGNVSWSNSSQVILDAFPHGPLWDSFTASHSRIHDEPVFTWQNGIVLDSGDPDYSQFLFDQLDAHIHNLSTSFQGIVIDRADHMSRYNLLADDGYSLVEGNIVRSLRASYRSVSQHLRQQLGNDRIMLVNGYSNSRVDMYKPFDGIFAEGYGVNSGGLLGAVTPSILWLYSLDECCSNETVTLRFWHRHLHMNVLPMAPFPGNDHSIPYSQQGQEIFSAWAPLVGATIAGRTPSLVPFACALVNDSAPSGSSPLVPVGAPLVSCSAGKEAEPQTHVVTALRYGEASGDSIEVVVRRLDQILHCPTSDAVTPTLDLLDATTGEWVAFSGSVQWFGVTSAAVAVPLTSGFGAGAVRFSCASQTTVLQQ